MIMTSDPSERRHFTRIPIDGQVSLETERGQEVHGRLLDMSLKGLLVSLPEGADVRAGQICQVRAELGGGTCIRLSGIVAHRDDGQVGIELDEIDIDSATNLRRLVELNLGDPKLLEREFTEFLKAER